MQSAPNYSAIHNEASFVIEFGIKFEGPGFYLTNTDTVLVVPYRIDGKVTLETVWNKEQLEGTMYRVSVFNSPWSKTIFAAICIAPTRVDRRD